LDEPYRKDAMNRAEATSDHLLTVIEAAHFLNRSERWVSEAIARDSKSKGSIPHYRLPGNRGGVRFIREDLIAWLKDGCPPTAAWESWRK